jgi:hypothetical protein
MIDHTPMNINKINSHHHYHLAQVGGLQAQQGFNFWVE